MESQNTQEHTTVNTDSMSAEEKVESLKEACGHTSDHQELDTSQGDFTTIAAGIFIALAIYALIPGITGIRLGDYPTVIVYGGFLVLVLIFWFLAEKVKEWLQKKNQ